MAPQRSWRALPKADRSCAHPLPPAPLPTSPLQQPPTAYVIESKHFSMVSKAMAIWPLPGPRMSSSSLVLWVAATLGCLPGPVHSQEGSLPNYHMAVSLSSCSLSRQTLPDCPSLKSQALPATVNITYVINITYVNLLRSPCHHPKVISLASSIGTKLQESQGPRLSSLPLYPCSRAMPHAQ